jgi:hypothetical protein
MALVIVGVCWSLVVLVVTVTSLAYAVFRVWIECDKLWEERILRRLRTKEELVKLIRKYK